MKAFHQSQLLTTIRVKVVGLGNTFFYSCTTCSSTHVQYTPAGYAHSHILLQANQNHEFVRSSLDKIRFARMRYDTGIQSVVRKKKREMASAMASPLYLIFHFS